MSRRQKTTKRERSGQCPLCAVDIGSSGIRAMAAEVNPDGTLHILGMETIPKYGVVDRGLIMQTSDVGSMIKRVLLLLSNRIGLHEPVDTVFTCTGGKLLQLKQVSVKRDLISSHYISDKLLAAMQEECRTKIEDRYNTMAVLSVEPVKYLLDGVEQKEAPSKTQKTRYLEIVYNVFVGRIESREKLKGSFARANISIEKQWVRPDALLTALADDNDMETGCAVIDFGAHTTTMSIYKDDRFLYTRVVPLGGYDINLNIQTQNVSFDLAEKLKLQFGCAAEDLVPQERTLSVRSNTPNGQPVRIETSYLAQIIQMKLYEAVEPLLQDLQQFEDVIGHVYITGGGCKLAGMQEYLQAMTPLPVEYGTHAAWLEETAPEEYYNPEYAVLIGTLANAAEHRRDCPDGPPDVPKPFLDKVWKKLEETTLEIFTDNN